MSRAIPVAKSSRLQKALPRRQSLLTQYVKLLHLCRSFFCSCHNTLRNFINISEFVQSHLFRARRRCEGERISADRRVRLPFLDPKRVLGRRADSLAGYYILARDRTSTDFDPQLPVHIEITKGEV